MTAATKKKDLFHYLKIATAILLIVLVVLLAVFGYKFGGDLFTDAGLAEKGQGVEYTLTVQKGESTFSVGRELKAAGIISSPLVFLVQSKLFKCTMTPGTYQVSSEQSSKAILKYLNAQGKK